MADQIADQMTDRGDDQSKGVEAIHAEAQKTRETAERIANGDSPPGAADDVRVLAGLVHQIAEQVERLTGLLAGGSGEAPPPQPSRGPSRAER